MIYEIRGVQVMLDRDLSNLYHVETKRINEDGVRNKEKFPERISWILDNTELDNLWSKISTLNINKMFEGNLKYLHNNVLYVDYYLEII